MKELVLFNGAAKIISAGVSTFGIGAGFVILSIVVLTVRQIFKKKKDVTVCSSCQRVKVLYSGNFLVQKGFISIVRDLKYNEVALKGTNYFLTSLARKPSLTERLVDIIRRKKSLRLHELCWGCVLNLGRNACQPLNIYVSRNSKIPVFSSGDKLTSDQECMVLLNFINHFD